MNIKKLLGSITGILFLCTIQTALAADPFIKEETTLPPAEGGLNVNQIPPIAMTGKTPPTAPTGQVPAPQAMPSAPTADSTSLAPSMPQQPTGQAPVPQ